MDALDTLYIMGLHEEFKDGQEWIEQNLDFGVVGLIPSVQSSNPSLSSIICPLIFSVFRQKSSSVHQSLTAFSPCSFSTSSDCAGSSLPSAALLNCLNTFESRLNFRLSLHPCWFFHMPSLLEEADLSSHITILPSVFSPH